MSRNIVNDIITMTNELETAQEKTELTKHLEGIVEQIKNKSSESDGIPTLPKEFWDNIKDDLSGNCPLYKSTLDFLEASSPRSYHLFRVGAVINLLSTVAAGRVYVEGGDDGQLTNFYILNCAHSSIFAKSEALGRTKRILKAANLEFLRLPSRITPSRLFSKMQPKDLDELSMEDKLKMDELRLEELKTINRFAGQRALVFDEMGNYIEAIVEDKGSHGGWSEILRRIFGEFDKLEDTTNEHGDRIIHNPYLTLVGNLTPADFWAINPKKLAKFKTDGFWARCLFAIPGPNDRPVWARTRKQVPIPSSVIKDLVSWHESLPYPEPAPAPFERITIRLADELQDLHDKLDFFLWGKLDNDNQMKSVYVRHAQKVLKLAGLLTSVNGKKVIGKQEYFLAIQICEMYRESLHRFFDMLDNPVTRNAKKEEQDYIIERIETSTKGGKTFHRSQLIRQMKRKSLFKNKEATYLENLIDDLIQAKIIIQKGKSMELC